MKTIETPFKPDIIIAGGGTAGSAAAVAAARGGHSVLLIEESNCLGGVSTAGGVNELYASLEGLGDIFARLVAELDNFGALHGRYFTGEYLKLIWQILADEAGFDILFNTSVVEAEVKHESLVRIRAVSASQFVTFEAKYFVDATGEAI